MSPSTNYAFIETYCSGSTTRLGRATLGGTIDPSSALLVSRCLRRLERLLIDRPRDVLGDE